MKTAVGAAASVVSGVALALIAVVGGVSAVSPGANPASASEQVVRYDAP